MQETSDWRTHGWNVMSEQRKSNWQHPNTYYRKREKTPGTDECDTSQHPHPYRTLPTKAVQIMADQAGDVVLEAVHFLVEIGNPRHPRLTSIHSIRSYDCFPAPTGVCQIPTIATIDQTLSILIQAAGGPENNSNNRLTMPTPRDINPNKRLTLIGAYQGAFHENSGDGNRFGNRVLNHTHFRQSGVCLRRPRLN
jgi:hypothetical protein